MNPIRLLTAREIECRVAQINKDGKGLSLLLYKDARCDMTILDETFGSTNWQRHHNRDNANCIVSVWDGEKRQWIDKEDTGTESNTEAEKGLASDSFKRACVNWGIGRELYTAPFIWVTPPNCEIKADDRGRMSCRDRFEVQEIGYNEHREINRLVIINAKTHNVAYEFGKASSDGQKRPKKPPQNTVDRNTVQQMKTPENGTQRVSGASMTGAGQMATPEQVAYIKENASDEVYEALMTEFGFDLEKLTANDAAREIQRIDAEAKAKEHTTCERCGNIITGIALPDGRIMTGAELIGKSKVSYGGCYCYACMKELSAKRKAG